MNAPVKTSVVCPFYNEAQIIETTVERLLEQLSTLEGEWELIVVDDGSTDGSGDLVRPLAEKNPRLHLAGYKHNRGRGHALRTGIARARGDVIVTTEIDLSWGEDIVHRLVAAMDEHTDADMVVASPHLPGGRYENVPAKRVWLSKMGNRIIRACMSGAVTMNTGMTRAYRREIVQTLPLYEDRKEFHLEVILKASAFGLRIHEIPAVLSWLEFKRAERAAGKPKVTRKSSSRINRLIVSHSLFSLFATPVRYVWTMSLVSIALGLASGVLAVFLYATGRTAAYTALLSLLLLIVGNMLFVLGVVLKQGHMVQREIWTMQRNQLAAAWRASEASGGGEPPSLSQRVG